MPNVEKKTMLVSTACIIAGMAFFAGLMLGSLVAMTRPAGVEQNVSRSAAPASEDGHVHSPEMDEHIARLRAEIARNPNEPLNWIHLGNVYFDNSHPAEAIEAYEKALAISPDNPDVLTDLGTMYRYSGNGSKAVELYDRAIALNPGHQNARYNKGLTTMIELGDPDGALKIWQDLLAALPDAKVGDGIPLVSVLSSILTSGGAHLEDARQNDKALRAYDLALERDAAFVPALARKGALLEKLNRQTEAYAAWQRLLEIDPQALTPDGRKVADLVRFR